MQHLQDVTSTLAHVGLASPASSKSHQNKCTTLPWPPFTAATLLLFCYLVQTVKKKIIIISRRQSRGGRRHGSRERDFTGPVSRFPWSLAHCLCLWIWQLLQAVVVAKSWKGAPVGSGKWRKTVCMSWRGEFRFLKRGQCELWIHFTINTTQCGVFFRAVCCVFSADSWWKTAEAQSEVSLLPVSTKKTKKNPTPFPWHVASSSCFSTTHQRTDFSVDAAQLTSLHSVHSY